jgi:hypothetical protein
MSMPQHESVMERESDARQLFSVAQFSYHQWLAKNLMAIKTSDTRTASHQPMKLI